MIESMVDFYNTIPDNASTYHEMDMLLSKIQRLGMLPPPDGADAVTSSIIYTYYDDRVSGDEDGRPIVEKLWESEG